MGQKKYVVRNNTIKEPRIDQRNGRDARSAVEKVGHGVSWRDENNNQVIVHPGKNPRIVTEVTEGLLRLQQAGYVTIDEAPDVMTTLKSHAYQADIGGREQQRQATDDRDRKAQATEMGNDTASSHKETQSVAPDAVNPDGDPSHVVTAPHNRKSGGKGKGKNRNSLDAPVEESKAEGSNETSSPASSGKEGTTETASL